MKNNINCEKILKKIENDKKCIPNCCFGIIGPTGPTGPTGPSTGATGPTYT